LSVSRPIDVVVLKFLSFAYERNIIFFEYFDNPCEVCQWAREPVDLVDEDDVDPAGLEIAQQPLQRWAFHGATGKPGIVVAVADKDPALMFLAQDVRNAASRCASRLLNSMSSRSSVETRV
jgi:hypothetical protein